MVEDGQAVRLPGHEVTFSPRTEQQVARFLQSLESEPYSPPTDNQPDAEVLGALVEQGRVVRVGDSVVFTADAYREMTGRIVSICGRTAASPSPRPAPCSTPAASTSCPCWSAWTRSK